MRLVWTCLLVVACIADTTKDKDSATPTDEDPADQTPVGEADSDDHTETDTADAVEPCAVAEREGSFAPDADGDGDSDADEAHAGTDPNDAQSRIYTGVWPYNAAKDTIADPGWDVPGADGATLPRFVDVDQYGQSVEIYDFAHQGVPVVLDMSTEWCAPCIAVADWLGGNEDALLDYPWWRDEYRCIPDLVNKGHILWITVLYEDGLHGDATPEVAQRWHEAHPHDLIPVLIDSDRLLHSHIRATGIPNANLLTENMVFDGFDDRGLDWVFDTLVDRYLE